MNKIEPNRLRFVEILSFVFVLSLPLVFSFWADSKKYDYDGARAMGVDSNDRLSIQLGDQLHRFDSDGAPRDSVDLATLGLTSFSGNLTFLSNDDLLVRKGGYNPDARESLAIHLRKSNLSNIAANADEGLFRCNLDTVTCRRFGNGTLELNQGFFAARDPTSGDVFVSDSSRHSVYKISAKGELLGTRDSGFDFPNQLVVSNEKLYLADTNHRLIKELSKSGSTIGLPVDVRTVANTSASKHGFNWPYGLLRAGGYWWIIMLDSKMSKGGVYLYDSNWRFVRSLSLRKDALPVALQVFNNEVLLTDLEATEVTRFGLDGSRQGVFNAPALQQHLAANSRKRRQFDVLRLVGLGLFASLLVLGIALAVRFHLLNSPDRRHADSAEFPEVLPLRDIVWMPVVNPVHKQSVQRNIQLGGLVLVALTFVSFLIYSHNNTESSALFGLGSPASPLLAMALLYLCFMLLFLGEIGRVQLGVIEEDRLVIRDRVSEQMVSAKGAEILYDGKTVSIDRMSAPVFKLRGSAIELESVVRHLYLPLSRSSAITPTAMLAYLWKNRDYRVMRLALGFGSFLLVIGFIVLAHHYLRLFDQFLS